MDSDFGSQLFNCPDLTGGANQRMQDGAAPTPAAGYAASMTETANTSPSDLNKRRRLSQLLDKLTTQVQNNNQYPPTSRWHMLTPQFGKPTEAVDEAPLDLSLPKIKKVPKPNAVETVRQAYVCNICGQTFAVQDRLVKHVASRHRSKAPQAVRAFECQVCNRKFARSDMLTRHSRLHSGLKPYSCRCGQVFSRSDHLVTHQRTHTGEKPYGCPECTYVACRRDMITRHMRTHNRRRRQLHG